MKINFVNMKKGFPVLRSDAFPWFGIDRYWGGKIIWFNVKHFSLVIDLRKDWVSDMIGGKR